MAFTLRKAGFTAFFISLAAVFALPALADSFQDHKAQAVSYYNSGSKEKAIAEFKMALDAAVSEEDASHMASAAAGVYADLKNWTEAERFFKIAISNDPANEAAHNGLGVVLYTVGRKKEACSEWEMALGLNPGYSEAASNLETVCKRNASPATRPPTPAEEIFKKHVYAADRFYIAEDYSKALDEYEYSFDLAPTSAKVLNNIGVVYFKMGDITNAEKSYLSALALNTRTAYSHNNLALILYDRGQFNDALSEWDAALRNDPDFEEARHNRALAVMLNGKPFNAAPAKYNLK